MKILTHWDGAIKSYSVQTLNNLNYAPYAKIVAFRLTILRACLRFKILIKRGIFDANRSYALNTYLGHLRYVLTASLTIPILASNQVKPVRKQNLSILKKARSEKRI